MTLGLARWRFDRALPLNEASARFTASLSFCISAMRLRRSAAFCARRRSMSGKDCLILILLATQEWMTNEVFQHAKIAPPDVAPRYDSYLQVAKMTGLSHSSRGG
jgi:hypothetical protein